MTTKDKLASELRMIMKTQGVTLEEAMDIRLEEARIEKHNRDLIKNRNSIEHFIETCQAKGWEWDGKIKRRRPITYVFDQEERVWRSVGGH